MFVIQYPEIDQPPFFAKDVQGVRDVLQEENGGFYRGMYGTSDNLITVDWTDNVGVNFSVVMFKMTNAEINMIKELEA